MRAYENETYNQIYMSKMNIGIEYIRSEYPNPDNDWYNISERIPMTEDDVFHVQQGYIGGVYYHWEIKDFPKYWVVYRGPYIIKPEWDYMDINAVREDGSIAASFVVSSNGHSISERRFNNLVSKLSDPDHDILKIRNTYLR